LGLLIVFEYLEILLDFGLSYPCQESEGYL